MAACGRRAGATQGFSQHRETKLIGGVSPPFVSAEEPQSFSPPAMTSSGEVIGPEWSPNIIR